MFGQNPWYLQLCSKFVEDHYGMFRTITNRDFTNIPKCLFVKTKAVNIE